MLTDGTHVQFSIDADLQVAIPLEYVPRQLLCSHGGGVAEQCTVGVVEVVVVRVEEVVLEMELAEDVTCTITEDG